MKDIQSLKDNRRIDIKKVGVKTITYPITVLDKSKSRQNTIATVNMYVNLPHHFKGTHMSRFIEILNRFHGRIDLKGFRTILEEMKTRLNAEAAHVEMSFPYFLKKNDALKDFHLQQYECTMHCLLEKEDDLRLDIVVPVAHAFSGKTTESSVNALGVWGNVYVSVRFNKFMWLEDLITLVETTIGSEFFVKTDGLLADQPMESLIGSLTARFKTLSELKWYSITVENVSQGYSLYTTMSSADNSKPY